MCVVFFLLFFGGGVEYDTSLFKKKIRRPIYY